MAIRSLCVAMIATALLSCCSAEVDSFLGGAKSRRLGMSVVQAASEELKAVMGAIMGCTADPRYAERFRCQQQLFGLGVYSSNREALLMPIWKALPKNEYGRVEWRSLRYMMHRHFMQRFQVLMKGFEPSLQITGEQNGTAQVMSDQVPALAHTLLDGPRAEHGFSLEEGAIMAEALEQMVFSSDEQLLQDMYKELRYSPSRLVGQKAVFSILKAFTVHWMLDGDTEGARLLLKNETLLEEAIPHWSEIQDMLNGSIVALRDMRQHNPHVGDGQLALLGWYSFQDVSELAGAIGKSFASYWETECQVIKSSLVAMDRDGKGRLSLSDFYGANRDGEWRFGESEHYLRQLGALDESSPWKGTQVLIANYLQAASNCIVQRGHYMVCCSNECEDILTDLEAAVGGSVACPDVIIDLVGNMTDFDDMPTLIDEDMRTQLYRVAETHHGKVPLHGRLFAQWLHYIFPHSCAFPHKVGSSLSVSPNQFGGDFFATDAEVQRHVENGKKTTTPSPALEDPGFASNSTIQWMTQWSEEEELPGDYSLELQAPPDLYSRLRMPTAALFAAACLVLALHRGLSKGGGLPALDAARELPNAGGGGGGVARGGQADAPRVHFV